MAILKTITLDVVEFYLLSRGNIKYVLNYELKPTLPSCLQRSLKLWSSGAAYLYRAHCVDDSLEE